MNRLSRTLCVAALVANVAQPNGNDSCDNATPIAGTGQFAFDFQGMTPGPAPSLCMEAVPDMYWQWTASTSGPYLIHTCGQTMVDTILEVSPGIACSPPNPAIACNDDACGTQSLVTFQAVAGTTYLLRLGKLGQGPSTGMLVVSEAQQGGSDSCATAVPITTGQDIPWSNLAATTDGPLVQGCPIECSEDVWYEWVAPATDLYSMDACGSATIDEVSLVVYGGSDCASAQEIACGSNRVGFLAQGGASYLFRVGSPVSGNTGYGLLHLRADPCDPSHQDGLEPNDSCAAATDMARGYYANLWLGAEEDWYRFRTAPTQRVQYEVFHDSKISPLLIRLYQNCVLLSEDRGKDHLSVFEVLTSDYPGYIELEVSHDAMSGPCNDACTSYDLYVDVEVPIGHKYCLSTDNSTGSPASIQVWAPATHDNVRITATVDAVPNQQIGFFFHGANQALRPYANGFLCTTRDIVRGDMIVSSHNFAKYEYDGSNARRDLSSFWGVTRRFQYWFRDPAGGGTQENLSDAAAALIQYY